MPSTWEVSNKDLYNEWMNWYIIIPVFLPAFFSWGNWSQKKKKNPLNITMSEWVKVSQSCPTLCNPIDCGLPGSSVHGILQARILQIGSHSLLHGIFPTQVSCIAGRFFTSWATRETQISQILWKHWLWNDSSSMFVHFSPQYYIKEWWF